MDISAKTQLRLEQALTGIAGSWRGAIEGDREELACGYVELLNMMLDWGIDVDLDPDGELPDQLMPDRYLNLRK